MVLTLPCCVELREARKALAAVTTSLTEAVCYVPWVPLAAFALTGRSASASVLATCCLKAVRASKTPAEANSAEIFISKGEMRIQGGQLLKILNY
ncbi:MAG: hypothetical protein EOO59_01645 [Hymenobacter sp.]|nr:MAG: hypothetical protein EOO59_01645 [Hymenobacter sp.]